MSLSPGVQVSKHLRFVGCLEVAITQDAEITVSHLTGYHAGGEKVTLFLDRRLSARSITLPSDKLHQLADMAREA